MKNLQITLATVIMPFGHAAGPGGVVLGPPKEVDGPK